MTEDLLRRLRDGDESAYGETLRRHGPTIYGFLLRLSGRRELAEDLLQETWLALTGHARTLDEGTRLEAWLLTVARNRYRSHRRWQWVDPSRWLVAEPDDTRPAHGSSPEDQALATETMGALETALASLGHEEREVLLLTSLDGLGPAEIAKVLGITQEAMRKRLSRAREALSNAMVKSGHPMPSRTP